MNYWTIIAHFVPCNKTMKWNVKKQHKFLVMMYTYHGIYYKIICDCGTQYPIVELSKYKSFNLVFVEMNRLTVMTHFVTCNKIITHEETTQIFLKNVYKYHVLHDKLIFDCDKQFTNFLQSLIKILKLNINLLYANQLWRLNKQNHWIKCWISIWITSSIIMNIIG